MKVFKIIILISIVFAIGCSKDDRIKTDCLETMLEQHNMVEYIDQEIACTMFLELYHHKNKQYFQLGNHCADLISYPMDCDGINLCRDETDSQCIDFHINAERIGIIGISE